MTTAQFLIAEGASKDIAALASGQDRSTVALNALQEALSSGTLSEQQRSQLKKIASSFEVNTNQRSVADMIALGVMDVAAISKEYPDSRQGFGPHKAIDFSVTLNSRVQASVLLVEILGNNDAAILISDWRMRVNFELQAPTDNKVVLFIESNNKARSSEYASPGYKTTQYDDFKAAGLQLADEIQATIVCATLVKKAKEVGLDFSQYASTWENQQAEAVGKLSRLEVNLLAKLTKGVVRTFSYALRVDAYGCLRAINFYNRSDAHAWALGGAAPTE